MDILNTFLQNLSRIMLISSTPPLISVFPLHISISTHITFHVHFTSLPSYQPF
jgi:hypothetical protein